MKKSVGCFLWLAVYVATFVFLMVAVERRLGRHPALFIGYVIVAGIAVLGISHLVKFVAKIGELWLIQKAMSGAEPQEGKRFAAIGPINPVGGTRLISPLTRTPAVAYSYIIHHRVSAHTQKWNGVGLVPCAIRSGVHSLRLLTFPEMGFTASPIAGDAVKRHAEEYVRSTEFPSQMSRDDGTVRNDLGPSGKPQSMKGFLFFEHVVKPGDVVCAIGTYSAARGALLLPRLEKAEPAQLFLSRASAVGSSLMNGVVTIAIVAAALTALYAFVPLNTRKPSWLEVRVEDLLDERVRLPIYRTEMFAGMPRIYPAETFSSAEARGRVRTPAGEATIDRAFVRGDDVLLYEGEREVAVLTLNHVGDLVRVRVLGTEIPPPAGFTLKRFSENEVVGQISFMKDDALAFHAIFKALRIPEPET